MDRTQEYPVVSQRSGGAVLVRDSAGVGAGAAYELLAGESTARQVLAVLYERSPSAFLEGWRDRRVDPPADMGVIEVGGQTRSAATDADGPLPTVVTGVGCPEDVAAVEDVAERYLREWAGSDGRTAVYLDSLSVLLRRLGPVRTADFLDRFAAAIRSDATVGYVFVGDDLDDLTLAGLALRFDAAVELAADGDGWTAVDRTPRSSAGGCDPSLSTDTAADLLAAPERRAVLSHLALSGAASTGELAAYVARHATRPDPHHVEVALYQNHLPRLAAAGAVRFDEAAGTAERGEQVGALLPFLDLAWSYDDDPPGQ